MINSFPGYAGKILRINLSERNYKEESLDIELAKEYIGGRGLGIRLLLQEVPATTDPLSPKNKLIFTVGPFTGTPFPTSCREIVVTKSPQTDIYLYSMAGGYFGLELKKAGYDGLIIEERSSEPVSLYIREGKVNFLEANHLWGMRTTPAIMRIKETLKGRPRIICIGPAGERRVKFSSIVTDDHRTFGRGGAGAVMGSKNLKAIAVEREGKGTDIIIKNVKEFNQHLKKIFEFLREFPGPRKEFALYGSGESVEILNVLGILPTKNWNFGTFDGAKAISMITMRDEKNLVVKDVGCYGCPVRCTNLTLVREGQYAGAFNDGPEFETIYALGSNCGIDNPEFIIAANMLCDELGLDTISTGVTIGFAMECFEKGLINEKDLQGRILNFGNYETAYSLIEDIGFRRGLGNLLGEGTRIASNQIGGGSEKFAMQVKGLEMGGYDPRGAKGQSIIYAAGNRGGCHHGIGLTATAEIAKGIRYDIAGKGKMVKASARARILQDSFPNCTFSYVRTYNTEFFGSILNSITGFDYNIDQLNLIADRINTLERIFNFKAGVKSEDDILPQRLMEEPLCDGMAKGNVVAREELLQMLEEYYIEMGWDGKTGIPLEENIEKLGIGNIVGDFK